MDIDKALVRLAGASLDDIDLSQAEICIMRDIAQLTAVVRSQTPIRFGAMAMALVVGMSLGGMAASSSHDTETLISGAHLAPSSLLAFPS